MSQPMSKEQLMSVLLAPHVTEKTSHRDAERTTSTRSASAAMPPSPKSRRPSN